MTDIDRFLSLPYTARPLTRHGEIGAVTGVDADHLLTPVECRHTGLAAEGLTLKRVLIAQLMALVVVVIAFQVLAPADMRSVLFGAGISLVGNGYAAWQVFSRSAKKPTQGELFNLYRAEFGKLVIVGALCAAVFATVEEVRIVGFLTGLLVGMITATVAVVTQRVQLPVEKEIQH